MNTEQRSWLALMMVCSAVFCAFVSVFAIPPLLGALARDFHIPLSRAGLFMTAFTLIPATCSLIIGALTDRVGMRVAAITGLLVLAAAGAASSFTHGFASMLLCRILIGIGATSIFVPGLGTVLYLLPSDRVNVATGAFFSSLNLGLTAAMLATPMLAANFGWRTPLRLAAGLCVVVAGVIFVRSSSDLFQPRSEGRREQGGPGQPGGSASLALALVSIGNFLLFFQSFGMITWLPEYLRDARAFSPAIVGSISMLLGLVVIPGSILAGWLADRIGPWLVAIVGAAMCAAGPAAMVLIPSLGRAALSIDVFFISLGTSLLTIPLTSVLSHLVSQRNRGRAVGLILTTGYAGGILSTFGGGYLITTTGGFQWTFAMCALSMVAALGLLVFLRPVYRSTAAASAAHT